ICPTQSMLAMVDDSRDPPAVNVK
ncbi:hypothetical protein A2U01_0058836, partial [Trifolium medium]|nr:hypothetical protein [Trifolium medium]